MILGKKNSPSKRTERPTIIVVRAPVQCPWRQRADCFSS
jgi:hypothetical protein